MSSQLFCDLEDAKLVTFAPWETHLVYYVFLPSERSKNGQLLGCQIKLKRFKVQTLSIKSENVIKENKTIYRIGYSPETKTGYKEMPKKETNTTLKGHRHYDFAVFGSKLLKYLTRTFLLK